VTYSIFLDVLVAVLLAVTIGYAVVLNKRLGNLRRDRAKLEAMAGSFADATTRAEESIGRLKIMGDDLQRNIDKAQALHDDLTFLIDRGGAAADQLEDVVREARKEGGIKPPKKAPADFPADSIEPTPQRPQMHKATAAGQKPEHSPRPEPSLSTGPLLEKELGEDISSNDFGRREPIGPARSEAERELLKALQAAR